MGVFLIKWAWPKIFACASRTVVLQPQYSKNPRSAPATSLKKNYINLKVEVGIGVLKSMQTRVVGIRYMLLIPTPSY